MLLLLNENSYGFTHLDVSVDYNKGGYNYFTYKDEERGFYVSVSPIKKSGCMVEYTAFSGVKTLYESCKRYSKKRHAELNNDILTIANNLIEYVLNKYNLTINK